LVGQWTQHKNWLVVGHNTKIGWSLDTTQKLVGRWTQHKNWLVDGHNTKIGWSMDATLKLVGQWSQHDMTRVQATVDRISSGQVEDIKLLVKRK